MLAKLTTLVHGKAALALLGIALVGGSGGAVVVAASGHLTTHGVNLNTANIVNTSSASTKTPDSHAHTVGVEGLLTACSTTAKTLTVKDSAGKSWTFVVSATTKINGDIHSASSAQGAGSSHAGGNGGGNGAGASSAKGDNSAHAGDTSAKGDTSAHAAPTLADVCLAANIGSRSVQVQATPDGAAYDAWKVTLQGPGDANGGSVSD